LASEGEPWIFTVRLPAGLPNPGRFVAVILKHLLRRWGVRCTAIGRDAEVSRLQGIIEGLTRRVAAQAELLGRRADAKGVDGGR
jgi:hypothetical protein